MRMTARLVQLCVALLLVLSGLNVQAHAAQAAKQAYAPRVGQAGKDVVWVPTPESLVDKMLELGKVTPNDYLIDLGSGDGRTVITAAKRGTRAHGIEYNPGHGRVVEAKRRHGRGQR